MRLQQRVRLSQNSKVPLFDKLNFNFLRHTSYFQVHNNITPKLWSGNYILISFILWVNMKALTYLFFIAFLLIHNHTMSMQNHNPRYERMLKGRVPSPPPPSSSRLNHQEAPRAPSARRATALIIHPPPPAPPMSKPLPPLYSVEPPPPAY